jgi:hypothetical protein
MPQRSATTGVTSRALNGECTSDANGNGVPKDTLNSCGLVQHPARCGSFHAMTRTRAGRALTTVAFLIAGYASLKVHDGDSFAVAAGKVVFRAPLAVVTVGISEIAIAGNADKADTAALRDYLLNEVAADCR